MRVVRGLATLAVVVAAPAAAQENAATNGRAIATLADVTVKSRDGRTIPLGSRIAAGRPTLVSIWASWCGPCIAEAPYLNRIRKAQGARVNFLYVNRREGDADPSQPPAAVAQFLARAGMGDVDYVVADVAAYRRIVGGDMRDIPQGKVGIPRVYLFDAKGRQVHTAYGFGEGGGPALEARVKRAVVAR